MADKKISQLTAATTPLAGTEVLPIVQSGSTVKVSIANVTAGRDVGTAGLTSTGNVSFDGGSFVFNDSGADKDARFEGDTNTHLLFTDASADRVGINSSAPAAKMDVVGPYVDAAPSTSSVPIIRANVGGATSLWIGARGYTSAWMQAIQDDGTNNLKNLLLNPLGGGTQVGGALEIASENLIIGTAAKGIDFSANTGAAGETSALLDWYEEGTWTPTYATTGVAFDAVTYDPLRYGRYTRIGNKVFCEGVLRTDSITVGSATGDVVIGGLPFTAVANDGSGVGAPGTVTAAVAFDFAGDYPYGGRVFPNTTVAELNYKTGANTGSLALQIADLGTGANSNYLAFSIVYTAA